MNLVLLLHGYGGCSEDILESFKMLKDIDGLRCIAPDAPFPCDLFTKKRQWFKFSNIDKYLSEQIQIQAE